MSDQSPEIKPEDIGYDMAAKGGDTINFAGVTTGRFSSNRQYGKSILFSLMYSVKGRHKIYGPDCLVCGKIEFNHGMFPDDPKVHPFCGDNLSYLAWKYDCKHK